MTTVDDDHNTWSHVTMFRKYMEHIPGEMSFTDIQYQLNIVCKYFDYEVSQVDI